MLNIYGTPFSVHTRKVIVAAIYKGLAYDVVPVVPVIHGNPPPNWRALSPAGLIPAITDGDFTLSDSTAIGTYLDQMYPQKPLYPSPARERALTLSLEAFAGDKLFREVVRPLLHERFIGPKIHKRPTNEDVVQRVLNESLPEVFGALDRTAGNGYLVGGQLSMADVAVVSNLLNFDYAGFDLDRSRSGRACGVVSR
jgi:glutathione S-transferase